MINAREVAIDCLVQRIRAIFGNIDILNDILFDYLNFFNCSVHRDCIILYFLLLNLGGIIWFFKCSKGGDIEGVPHSIANESLRSLD